MIVGPAICSKQIVRSDPQITLGTPNWWFWTHSMPPCLFLLPIARQLTYHGYFVSNFLLTPDASYLRLPPASTVGNQLRHRVCFDSGTRKCVVSFWFGVLKA